ncbi:MAG: ATP-binding protein [Saprospiraceae bacterium]
MDSELLRLKERVEIALEIGESYYREFKTAFQTEVENIGENRVKKQKPRDVKEVCHDIAKTLVAFANADGGELFVGVEDDNRVTGLQYNDEKNENDIILKAPSTHVHQDTPLPIKRATLINYDGLKVAYFSVEKGSKYVHLTSKGECFQRKDRESVPTASEHIRFLREEEVSREYDRQFVDLAYISDLDLHLVSDVAQHVSKSMSPEKFLQYLELAEFDGDRLRLRRAALLLFSKNPLKWHPRCQVRILRIKGVEEKTGENFNVEEIAEVSGNIFSLIEASWDRLRPNLTETRFSKDALFKTQIIYPELACKEALINAITHRDYSIEGRGIEIRIFDDRLEILSPGKLLSSITIKDLQELKGVHQTRNTYVGRVLREFGYIRELGEGIRRMYELMKSNELIAPKIESPNKSFIVTLFYKHIYSKEEKLWLDNFENLNLSREQKTVVRLGLDGKLISPKQIWESVGIVDTEYYRQLVESLAKIGILTTETSKAKAQSIARNKKISVKDVPRFKIILPQEIKTKIQSSKLMPAHRLSDAKKNIDIVDTSDYSKIFVGNLAYSVTESELIEFFAKYGEVSDASIARDYNTKLSKGFGFVEFELDTVVKKLLADEQPKLLAGRRLFIQEYKKYS